MRNVRDTPDRQIARIAARQHGVVTIRQLLGAGLSKAGVHRREAAGRLHRVHRGVYAVGHRGLGSKGHWKAATLASGEGAVLSHRSAAELWRILEPSPGDAHVTVAGTQGRARRAGIQLHRSRTLTKSMTTIRDSIPVTRPGRTLTDLRRVVSEGELRRAVRQAEFLDLPLADFELLPDRTASELELIFLRLCRRHRVPEPQVDVRIARFRVDFLWPAQRVIVETDGYRYHRGSVAFHDDRRRDNSLMHLGYDVIRFTYWSVVNEPGRVIGLLRARLERGARLHGVSA
jgi:very-short-patch-repair endonuclease